MGRSLVLLTLMVAVVVLIAGFGGLASELLLATDMAVFLLGAGFGALREDFSACFSSADMLASKFSVDFLRNFLGIAGLRVSSDVVLRTAGFGGANMEL